MQAKALKCIPSRNYGEQTEVEEGCWVPCIERKEWCERILDMSLTEVVSDWEKQVKIELEIWQIEEECKNMKLMKCPECKKIFNIHP